MLVQISGLSNTLCFTFGHYVMKHCFDSIDTENSVKTVLTFSNFFSKFDAGVIRESQLCCLKSGPLCCLLQLCSQVHEVHI